MLHQLRIGLHSLKATKLILINRLHISNEEFIIAQHQNLNMNHHHLQLGPKITDLNDLTLMVQYTLLVKYTFAGINFRFREFFGVREVSTAKVYTNKKAWAM